MAAEARRSNIDTARRRFMTPQSDHAGVWFPPPFWYAFAVLGGVLLDRRWPLPIVGGRLITVAGAVCVLGWMALAFDSIDRFRRSKTTIVPIRPAEALVLTGSYRYTRNPMYVSLALLTIGMWAAVGHVVAHRAASTSAGDRPDVRDPSRGALSPAAVRRSL
jgi:protein-S-isoprenylcysteine O-methyltransferase Ste14